MVTLTRASTSKQACPNFSKISLDVILAISPAVSDNLSPLPPMKKNLNAKLGTVH